MSKYKSYEKILNSKKYSNLDTGNQEIEKYSPKVEIIYCDSKRQRL